MYNAGVKCPEIHQNYGLLPGRRWPSEVPRYPFEMRVLMVVSAVSLQTHLVSKADSSQSTEVTNQPLNSNAETNRSLETARRVWCRAEESWLSLPICHVPVCLTGPLPGTVARRKRCGSAVTQALYGQPAWSSWSRRVEQSWRRCSGRWLGSASIEQPECGRAVQLVCSTVQWNKCWKSFYLSW